MAAYARGRYRHTVHGLWPAPCLGGSVRRAWAELVCFVVGHRFEAIERTHPPSRRSALVGALSRCTRCEMRVDWREPSAGPTYRPGPS